MYSGPAMSPITAKYGNPAQRAAEEMKRRFALNRLKELEQDETQRQDYATYRSAASSATGPRHSGYDSESDYRAGLNRQGEMADLQSRLSGKGPARVNHSYAGTSFAERDETMRPSLSALRGGGQRADVDDATNYQMGRAQLAGMQADARRREHAADESAFAADPYRIASRAKVDREQDALDAEAAAQNELTEYSILDPMRRDQAFERRRALREEGSEKERIAQIEADAKVREAHAKRKSDRPAALSALANIEKTMTGVKPTVEKRERRGMFGNEDSGIPLLSGLNDWLWPDKMSEAENPEYGRLNSTRQAIVDELNQGGDDTPSLTRENFMDPEIIENLRAEGITVSPNAADEELAEIARRFGYRYAPR